jgi:hypothetical protein
MEKENMSYPDACQHLGIPIAERNRDTFAVRVDGQWIHFPINTTYDYVDEHGKLLYQVVRYTRDGKNKNFGQRQPDASKKSGWRQGTKGIELVPYALPAVRRATEADKVVYVVEGEKSADYVGSCGFCATTNVGGCGMGKKVYTPEYCEYFRGARVVVVADNDTQGQGQAHARMIAERLEGIAASVDMRLSGRWEEAKGQGLDDWLEHGGAIDDLPGLDEPSDSTDASLPQIDIASGELGTIVTELWQHVLASPYAARLYRYGDTLVLHGDDGIQTLDNVRWRGIVSRCAVRYDSAPKRPRALLWRTNDPEIADSLLHIPDTIPVIERIVSMPVFSQDGKLLTNGYHATERVLVQSPINPQEMSIEEAKALLWELFQDFPFATESDYANTIGYLLLPFIRSMCGATPLHLIDAAQRGTGKGLLNDIIHSVWGVENEVGGLPLMEEEQRKAITSRLASAPLSVAFDDVSLLQGHALQRAITARIWTDRLLGGNKNITVPVQCIWSATGNNTTLAGDMVRRVVLIRLESQHERPEDRTDTKRSESELRLWAIQNRTEFVSACVSLIQHGLAHGNAGGVAFGGFDEYASVLGRILAGCGIDGFLGNRVSAYEREDTRQTGWKHVIREWYERWGSEPQKAKDILRLVDDLEDYGVYVDGETERARVTKIGKEAQKRIGTVYAYDDIRLRLVRSKTKDGKSKPAFSVEELPNFASESHPPTSPTSPTSPRQVSTCARAHAHEGFRSTNVGEVGEVGESDCNGENSKNNAPTRQEAAAARYREEDYCVALLAKLITPDTSKEERTRLYAMETSELEALVHETIGTHEKRGMG